VAFCFIEPCSLVVVKQSFGERAASIFRVEIRDEADISTALLPSLRGSLCLIRCLTAKK
jgi:hypothetical protein